MSYPISGLVKSYKAKGYETDHPLVVRYWMFLPTKGAFDWEISQSNAKSEDGFHLREIHTQGGFQLRNPNPDFLDFPFCRSIGKSEKGFAKLFS